MFGTMIATDLTAAGKTGVSIHAAYDFWSPARHYQAFHTGLRLLTESASARIASPVTLTADQIAGTALGYNPRERFLELPGAVDGRRLAAARHHRLPVDRLRIGAVQTRRCIAKSYCRNFYRVGERQIARTEPWGLRNSG